MEAQTTEQGNDNEAAKAFGKLRREVTTMRLAIEQLVDEPNRINIPDYSETLGDITAHMSNMIRAMRAMQESPALELTPEQLARQIVAARKETQAAERVSLDQAVAALDKATSSIGVYVENARTADTQNKWMLGFGGVCFVLGMVVTVIVQTWL